MFRVKVIKLSNTVKHCIFSFKCVY